MAGRIDGSKGDIIEEDEKSVEQEEGNLNSGGRESTMKPLSMVEKPV
jgi:hypothetical protein